MSESIKNHNGASSDARSPEIARCELTETSIYRVALALSSWLEAPDDAYCLWQSALENEPQLENLLPSHIASSRDLGSVAHWILQAIQNGVIHETPSKKRALPAFRDHRELVADRESFSRGPDADASPLEWLRRVCFRTIEKKSDERRHGESVEASTRRALYNLAYGLSHEINNPLANISARAQLLLGSAATPDAQKNLAVIIEQCTRAHEMLAEVMLAVQPPSLHCRPTDIVPVVREFTRFAAEQSERKHIQFRPSIPNDPIYCDIDATAILEALRAIFLNALEACRQGDTIELHLSLLSPYAPSHSGSN